jgi:hypothetical protein
MSSFKRFPTSIRYLIARLRHWTQPTVWAPLAVLCAGGVFIWEVSVHPERLSIDDEDVPASNSPASTGLSADDRAIAAEIDSVPALVKQLNRSNSEFGLLNSSAVKEKGLFDGITARGLEIPKPPSAPKPPTSRAFLPLPSLANSAVGVHNNNPPNSSSQSSNATATLSPSSDSGLISGMKSPGPESGSTATVTLPTATVAGNLGKQTDNPVPLSPLQTAMKKYIAANTTVAATSTQKAVNLAKLIDRPTSTQTEANQANLLPTGTTAQTGANPINLPTALPPISTPTNTMVNDSQQFLNPAATAPESSLGLNLKVPNIPAINPQPATQALPKNPYQTNLSGSDSAPEAQPAALPIATPSPIPLSPTNLGQPSFPSAIGGSKIQGPQFYPNPANSQFQLVQPNQPNLPNQHNFGAVPQNTNQGVQPIQPQSFSTPRSLTPGRYIGGGEINTFANP